MSSTDSIKTLLATSGGDTVKLFDISVEPRDPCILSYTPSPGSQVNSIKWNHNNLVVASAGEDKKISLWRKNGQSLGTIPVSGTESGDNIEESISTICFSNKPSRYLCSGGSGQVVRIWDLKQKRCIKWLKGHTDCITGVMYNCKDEHLASISVNGVLIMHNLVSGAKAAELKDPNKQILRALDYSRTSRHLLATAGDDGSIHLWDTTARNPKVSWLKQHSAPISGVSFSPSNDKMIATVGLDKKLYIFDSGSRRHSFCIPFDAPFSSMSFTDDGLKLAAGTSSGRVVFYDVRGKPQPFTMLRAYSNSEAVTSLCWQRSKPVIVNEHSSTLETVLLGGSVEDSVLMPDPLPSSSTGISVSTSSVSGSQNSNHAFSFLAGTTSVSTPEEETPIKSSLWTSGTLTRLHAPREYIKDDMEVFSPLVDVQPITPSLDKLLDEHGGLKKDHDTKTHFLYPSSRRVPLPEDVSSTDVHPIIDWKSTSTSKQEDLSSFSQLTPTHSTYYGGTEISSVTPPEAWGGGERLSDKLSQFRQSINNSSRLPTMSSTSLMSGSMFSGMQDVTLPVNHNTNSNSLSISSIGGPTNFRGVREAASKTDMAFGSSDASSLLSSSVENLDSVNPSSPFTRRFSSYAERISTVPSFIDGNTLTAAGSPKTKKTGGETKEELLNSWLARSDKASIGEAGVLPPMNGGVMQQQPPRSTSSSELQHGGNSFTFQLFQRSLEETLSSFQKSIHEDMRNLHIEIIRQFHIQEMETTNSMRVILENQAELMKEVISLRKETQQLRQLL